MRPRRLKLSQPRLDDGRDRFGAEQPPDPARRVLTFTTPPLQRGFGDRRADQAHPLRVLDRDDIDFFVKLSEQLPQSPGDLARALNPAYFWITKGWLRASHRALDPRRSPSWSPTTTPTPAPRARENLPFRHQHRADGAPLQERQSGPARNGERRFRRHRRAVDALLLPNKIGADTIYHSAEHPSALILPVLEGA